MKSIEVEDFGSAKQVEVFIRKLGEHKRKLVTENKLKWSEVLTWMKGDVIRAIVETTATHHMYNHFTPFRIRVVDKTRRIVIANELRQLEGGRLMEESKPSVVLTIDILRMNNFRKDEPPTERKPYVHKEDEHEVGDNVEGCCLCGDCARTKSCTVSEMYETRIEKCCSEMTVYETRIEKCGDKARIVHCKNFEPK